MNKDRLSPEEKELLFSFLKEFEEWEQHKKEESVNGWYFYTQLNTAQYCGDKGYYAEYLPLGITLDLGMEWMGRLNSINLLKAVLNDKDNPTVKDCCYDCEEYYDASKYHGIQCAVMEELCFNSNLVDLLNYRDRVCGSREKCCRFVKSDEDTLRLDFFKEYDTLDDEFHRVNAFNDWSLFSVNTVRWNSFHREIKIYLAKHLPTGCVVWLGNHFEKRGRNEGIKQFRKFFSIISGRISVGGCVSDCESCVYYTGIDYVCFKNHFVGGRCGDYVRR